MVEIEVVAEELVQADFSSVSKKQQNLVQMVESFIVSPALNALSTVTLLICAHVVKRQ